MNEANDEAIQNDTLAANLVVLGAYIKDGKKSSVLMGNYNGKQLKWLTVTIVENGFDDRVLARLQNQLYGTPTLLGTPI